MPNSEPKAPFINAQALPAPTNRYVAWLDVMGVQSIMSRSLPISANFIFRFHAVALDAAGTKISLFPVMDGIYAVTDDQGAIKQFLTDALVRLSTVFIKEKEDRHRFMVRCGLAYGPVIFGSNVSAKAAPTLAQAPQHAGSLLLGMPVIQSHLAERNAPPFGVYITESARAFAPSGANPFHEAWWTWFEPQHHKMAVSLGKVMKSYFTWCQNHSYALLYQDDRIKVHCEMSRQHLPEK